MCSAGRHLEAGPRRINFEVKDESPDVTLEKLGKKVPLEITVKGTLPAKPKLTATFREATVKEVLKWFADETGVVFHLLGCLSEFGKLGCTAIAPSVDEARARYQRVVEILDGEIQADRIVVEIQLHVAVVTQPQQPEGQRQREQAILVGVPRHHVQRLGSDRALGGSRVMLHLRGAGLHGQERGGPGEPASHRLEPGIRIRFAGGAVDIHVGRHHVDTESE